MCLSPAKSTVWSTADSTFTYKIQLYFYKFLIEGSREYANYKVTKGRLDYIPVSEEDGETHSLEVVFKDSEAAEIRQLIQRVYESIVTLNLPDTTEANQSNNPTKAFYDQLLCKN